MPLTLKPGTPVTIRAANPKHPAFGGIFIGPNVSTAGAVSDTHSVIRIPHIGGKHSSLSVVSNDRLG